MKQRETGRLTPEVTEQDHAQGPQSAPVTLVVYGDYECPYTRESMQVVTDIRERLGDRLQFVFRNFPLYEIHPHALRAAEAAEAASAQGKFWEMHRHLFAHQQALEENDLLQYATDLGLEAAGFAGDITGHAQMARIEEDMEGGAASGVQGTPTFFINGLRHDDSWELNALLTAIERAASTRLEPSHDHARDDHARDDHHQPLYKGIGSDRAGRPTTPELDNMDEDRGV